MRKYKSVKHQNKTGEAVAHDFLRASNYRYKTLRIQGERYFDQSPAA